MRVSTAPLPLVMLGAGGHAKVLLSLARAAGMSVVGVVDPLLASAGVRQWRGVPVLGDDAALDELDPKRIALVNGIGQTATGHDRRRLLERVAPRAFHFPALIHPAATVDDTTQLAEGVQVMAGAVVQADCSIGPHTIVNTRAGVDHDCVIGSHVHLAPAATLCGGVHVGDGAFVASGATLAPGVIVGRDTVVGAGTLLLRNLADGERWLGPSRN